MVAATQPPQQLPAATSTTTSVEEEALKRNTDCVYFLASPLTCKKGSECEYRHSEYARMNPRDCWYWLNGNCLNPKCSFRHPPLDGLLGTQVASAGPSLPSSQTSSIPTTQASHISGKQGVSCIFFQKGLCVKGDRCAFLHGPRPTSNKAPQVQAAPPKAEPPTLNKPFGSLTKCTQEYKVPQVPQAYKPKSVEVPVAKPALKSELVPLRNGVGNGKIVPDPTHLGNEYLRYQASDVSAANNGNSVNRFNRSNHIYTSDDQSLQNKDADEFLRESSPGFDVLVDDELGDSDYYHGEDQFGRARVHEGMNAVDDYDVGHSVDYSPMVDVDQERFLDPRGYDSHDQINGQYAWEHQRASSERISGPTHLEKRGYPISEIRDHIGESDLRHRLSKHRRVNGLRSVVSKDYSNDNHEEQSYHGSSRSDSHHLPTRASSLSSRLRGRIKLPRRSPVNGSDLHPEREMDRGRNCGRLSPGRSHISSQHGRLRDRIKGRGQEEYNIEAQNLRAPHMSREVTDAASSDFAAPKSLSELKGARNAENREQQFLGKRKNMKFEDHQQGEDELAFEGPKPLSEILKRKKGVRVTSSGDGSSFNNDNQKDMKERSASSSKIITEVPDDKSGLFIATEAVGNNLAISNKEEPNSATADGHSSQVLNNASELQFEDGLIVDEGMEDHEYEADDQKEEDYDYKHTEEGDYNFDEGDNVYPEEEYLEEDEDGDDFAKKIGVV